MLRARVEATTSERKCSPPGTPLQSAGVPFIFQNGSWFLGCRLWQRWMARESALAKRIAVSLLSPPGIPKLISANERVCTLTVVVVPNVEMVFTRDFWEERSLSWKTTLQVWPSPGIAKGAGSKSSHRGIEISSLVSLSKLRCAWLV